MGSAFTQYRKGSNQIVRNEVPGGSVNGSNTAFTTSSGFVADSLTVYVNGVRQKGGGNDFTEGDTAFTMTTAPETGDLLLVDYSSTNTFDSLDAIYPVGAIYTSVVSTTPATLFGGTWVAIAEGRVLVGIDSGDTDFDTVEEETGAKTHVHELETGFAKIDGTTNIINYARVATESWDYSLKWTGSLAYASASGSKTRAAQLGGDTDTGSSVQPSLVVYMWKRTA